MDTLAFAIQAHKGSMLLAQIEQTIIAFRSLNSPSCHARQQSAERLNSLNSQLVRHLRNENADVPPWEDYPIARDWFTQH
jgi:hypothetical protein